MALHYLDDPRVRRHFGQIEDEEKTGLMSSLNLSEFYYKTCQALGRTVADLRYYQTRRTRLKIIETDEELSRTAGIEKCRQPYKLSIADCYALALAKHYKSTILTTDGQLAKVKEVRSILFEI